MTTKAIDGQANIDGVMSDLTGEGYVNIGGTLYPLTLANLNIDGALMESGGSSGCTVTWEANENDITGSYETYVRLDGVTLNPGDTVIVQAGTELEAYVSGWFSASITLNGTTVASINHGGTYSAGTTYTMIITKNIKISGTSGIFDPVLYIEEV